MKLIDTHFHLDFYRDHKFWYDRINQLEQYTLCVTNSPEIFYSCKKLYSDTKYIKFALGYNPQISTCTPFNKQLFISQLGSTKYIGEVGLDFSAKNVISKAAQIEAFNYICCNAAKYDKVLSVHSRKAEKETFEILVQNGVKRAVIHWYTGDIETLNLFVHAGYYFSVNANMCMSSGGQTIIRNIPLKRILVESDGPFTKSGGKKFTPIDLSKTYTLLTDILGCSDVQNVVFDNFKYLLTSL